MRTLMITINVYRASTSQAVLAAGCKPRPVKILYFDVIPSIMRVCMSNMYN